MGEMTTISPDSTCETCIKDATDILAPNHDNVDEASIVLHGIRTSFNPAHATTNKEIILMAAAKTDTWELIDAVLGVTRRTLLYGPPGTGKTYAANRFGLHDDQKVYAITVTEETPAAELRGHFIPKGEEFVWMDGPGLRAWREGSRLVINEIDRASADTMSFLNALLDDPDFAELTLPTGEVVRPAPGFSVVATMNGEPEDLEPSLQDRFPVTIHIGEVNPEALQHLDADLREAAENTALAGGARRVSIRAWQEYANLRSRLAEKKGVTKPQAQQIAAQAVFGKAAKEALRAMGVDSK